MDHNPDYSYCNILQWNTQGIQNKKDELLDIINKHKIDVIVVQETKTWENYNFSLPNYNCFFKHGHYNRTPHGGVGIFVHSSIPFKEINLTTNIQAMALQLSIYNRIISICNIYSSANHTLTLPDLQQLKRQIPSPFLIVGDFNGHSPMWDTSRIDTDARGKIMEEFMTTEVLTLLNDGRPTRVDGNSESAIDLSLCSPNISDLVEWNVLDSPGPSDHCPIILKIIGERNEQLDNVMEHWNTKKADWMTYEKSKVWNNLPPITEHSDPNYLVETFSKTILLACKEAIPVKKICKYYPKPWWSDDLKKSRDRREVLYQRHRRDISNIAKMVAWKRARAEHKYKTKMSQQESFRDYITTSINTNTPIAEIYETIRRIKGKSKRAIHILHQNNISYSTIPEIANKLADSFAESSSNMHYTEEFLNQKQIAERNVISFEPDQNETYNRPLARFELDEALQHINNSSPGPDNINYLMISNLPERAKDYLLDLYNLLWTKGYYPDSWKKAHVIPIAKPNKDPTKPLNYRPISLTSCLGKVLEKMVNTRLCDYLEKHGMLKKEQCGCRKNHSTMDHLVRLETVIRNSFVRGEHFVSIFFDLEKAYDTTWRYGIIKDLYDAGLRGRLPSLIKSFLENRKISVRINGVLSPEKDILNGVPQGGILSVTLFAVKVNGVLDQIPTTSQFHASLFVDDLQVGMRGFNLNEIYQQMQRVLNRIILWTDSNGFKFSSTKTKIVKFTKSNTALLEPNICMYNQRIPTVQCMRFLGLHFDSKLTWNEHISRIAADCNKRLNLIKTVTALKWGADQATSLKIYKTIIRSKMDYGCIVYNSASITNLKKLDIVVQQALRLITGAFKSSPNESLYILVNEWPLSLRRDMLSLRYYYKIRSLPSNPAFQSVLDTNRTNLFRNKNIKPSFAIRTQEIKQKLQMPREYIKPSFSYRILNINLPTWSFKCPSVNKSLMQFKKHETSDNEYRTYFRNLNENAYSNMTHLYTDGSVTDDGVGAAAWCSEHRITEALPKITSIYSAEIRAIELAITIIEQLTQTYFVIHSDSSSALASLQQLIPKNPFVRKIKHDIYRLASNNKIVCFNWVPAHVGIRGNEKADQLAKEATKKIPTFRPVVYTDMFSLIHKNIQKEFNRSWENSNQKLKEIKPSAEYWHPATSSRREEVIVNRLRLGHTLFTHSQLMDDSVPDVPALCPGCDDARVSVKHVLSECPHYSAIRRRFFGAPNPNLKDLLGKDSNLNKTLNFLREINLYDKI